MGEILTRGSKNGTTQSWMLSGQNCQLLNLLLFIKNTAPIILLQKEKTIREILSKKDTDSERKCVECEWDFRVICDSYPHFWHISSISGVRSLQRTHPSLHNPTKSHTYQQCRALTAKDLTGQAQPCPPGHSFLWSSASTCPLELRPLNKCLAEWVLTWPTGSFSCRQYFQQWEQSLCVSCWNLLKIPPQLWASFLPTVIQKTFPGSCVLCPNSTAPWFWWHSAVFLGERLTYKDIKEEF